MITHLPIPPASGAHPAQGAAPRSRNVILRGNFLTFPTLIGKTKPDPCCTAILGQGHVVNTNAN